MQTNQVGREIGSTTAVARGEPAVVNTEFPFGVGVNFMTFVDVKYQCETARCIPYS